MTNLVRALAGLAMASGLHGRVDAQVYWSNLHGSPGNTDAHYCYDTGRDEVLLLDRGLVTRTSGTWVRDPSGLWRFIGSIGPAPAGRGQLAYSAARQRIVCQADAIVGGGADTWEWDGATWVAAATNGTVGFDHVVGHLARGSVVGFGGPGPSNTFTDLFEWDGLQWNLIPVSSTPPRATSRYSTVRYPTMAYDARHDKIVLYGSAVFDFTGLVYTSYSPILWEWDAASGWSSMLLPLPGSGVPWQNLPWSRLYFDGSRGSLVFVTWDGVGHRTYELDDRTAWREIVPTSRFASYIGIDSLTEACDSRRGWMYAMQYDPLNSTYFGSTFENTNPALLDTIGAGCPGTLGQPTLDLLHTWTRAWLGRSLEVELTNLPTSTGIFVAGWSNQHVGTVPLPLALDPFGMPGCAARVAPDSVYVVAGSNHRATLSLPVPNHAALVGVSVYLQGWSPDPGANAFGMTVSNAVRAQIGHL